ncbi:stage III sporulation AC/AD family protein [Jeotgalibacillus sp. ET6]|uniref:stage III sporulation AC/AD family protein n=1 Tax=Jeotgalibacillus sp. ET6 TaxID=3037260 RepID=UPI002418827D|nr:stage III sporulation AC/AD family protein [Jeotgalibacillus sp. ET6]MDG5470769.1 stage III sporulation AC/AD family protein [Jeotgalibacillus sp. ET6]
MDELLRTIGICFLAGFMSLMLKEKSPAISMLLSLCAATMLLTQLFFSIQLVLGMVQRFSAYLPQMDLYISTLIKVLMIAFISETSAHLLKGAGQQLLATIVEWTGKIFILMIALPIFYELLQRMLTLLPGAQ